MLQARIAGADFSPFYKYVENRASIRDIDYLTKDGRTLFLTMARNINDIQQLGKGLEMEERINPDTLPDYWFLYV